MRTPCRTCIATNRKRRCAPAILFAAALFSPALLAGGCSEQDGGSRNVAQTATVTNGDFSSVTLLINAQNGGSHVFTVELAVDDLSQQQGLMGRTALAEDSGMLFPFPIPRMASFWMKNTPLPLDLIFIRPDGTIAAILPGRPDDLHPISAGEPVSAVLEIAQGRAAALGLAPGDRVQWGDCAGAPALAATPWQPDRFCPTGSD